MIHEKIEGDRLVLEVIDRDVPLQRLLDQLKAEDFLFEYNVPQHILTGDFSERIFTSKMAENFLLDHLRFVYAQKEFVITESDAVQKFLRRPGEKVIKKGDCDRTAYKLRAGTNGYVINHYPRESRCYFKPDSELLNKVLVPAADLMVFGKTTLSGAMKMMSPTILSHYKRRLTSRHLVTYFGEDILDYHQVVPDGTEGRLFCVLKNEFSIYWQPGKQVIQNGSSYASDELIMVVPNEIDFDKIYQEIYGGRK